MRTVDDAMLLFEQRADMQRLRAALDIGCLSSAFGKGFPNVLGEMMACGVPCVSRAVDDAAAIVGDTGHIVPPSSPDVLLALWHAGPAARLARGHAARIRIGLHFTLSRTIERYAALYRRLAPTHEPVRERS